MFGKVKRLELPVTSVGMACTSLPDVGIMLGQSKYPEALPPSLSLPVLLRELGHEPVLLRQFWPVRLPHLTQPE